MPLRADHCHIGQVIAGGHRQVSFNGLGPGDEFMNDLDAGRRLKLGELLFPLLDYRPTLKRREAERHRLLREKGRTREGNQNE